MCSCYRDPIATLQGLNSLGYGSAACDALATVFSETVIGAVVFEAVCMVLNAGALAFHGVGWAAGAKKGNWLDIGLDIAGFIPFADVARVGKVGWGAFKGRWSTRRWDVSRPSPTRSSRSWTTRGTYGTTWTPAPGQHVDTRRSPAPTTYRCEAQLTPKTIESKKFSQTKTLTIKVE
ncbi:hypothetical protein [Streptomyces shaanxiensis]|uniref:hypothetical protein n=1 Tax=Streptomyces shaanxiensis TaxID=653357 RepID=UPI0031EC6AE1